MGTEVKPVGSARDGDTPSLVMLLGFSKPITSCCDFAFPVKPSAYGQLAEKHSLLLWST